MMGLEVKRDAIVVSGAALLLLFATSCSPTPSVANAKEIINGRIERQSKGRIMLVSFQKTNGQMGEIFGVKVYQLSYKGEIEFLEECFWVKGMDAAAGLGPVSFRTVTRQEGLRNRLGALDNRRLMQKGARSEISGQITFEKTEKGWVQSR
jgi:hypothetical protein